MSDWIDCPHPLPVRFDADRLSASWERLHKGDAEPMPTDPDLLQAWVLFHNGEFQRATQAGLLLGDAGMNLANKATCIYATYLEPREQRRESLLLEAAARAQALQLRQPDNPGAWYWQAYALGRYSQGISVAKALANGLGARIKSALEKTIERAPQHADAHLALGTFHAEVIDKVGRMIARITYGATAEAGLALFQQAHSLNPDSAITLTEHARGLLMLEGRRQLSTATELQDRAASIEPLDAMEQLYLETARLD
ncbi:tetratricopeptide (TPR) repeat protein [Hydrogenophaga palleronii]|uniref:Tetratricopeptide (TPR) repeat protein n=1 Tax=Hydrogenophaga palleronii TaxID=65655 RepID=A0ABU1WTK1_9BURK|nr:hypothetical protein [Hydrogenophaga palleronii]MDR7152362.1 tetratricopeptide (TPR) repeat protein [Hydrogenophaga palleronii]